MIRILIVSSENVFADALTSIFKKKKEVTLTRAESGNQGLSMVKDQNYHLVITDEILSDMTGLEFAGKMLSVNPMINCAAASSLSHDEFHEASEGLGILMALPLKPGENHVNRLMEHLQKILQYTIS
ncbi:MAG: response regulator [Desulfobacteraceae bacterium]|nr:MAG: response regulator [Desulfobacteraceae bacterium]